MNEKNNMETELDPEVIKVRDKIISKIGNKPLDEVNSIIKKLLNDQTDEVTRLGLLINRRQDWLKVEEVDVVQRICGVLPQRVLFSLY